MGLHIRLGIPYRPRAVENVRQTTLVTCIINFSDMAEAFFFPVRSSTNYVDEKLSVRKCYLEVLCRRSFWFYWHFPILNRDTTLYWLYGTREITAECPTAMILMSIQSIFWNSGWGFHGWIGFCQASKTYSEVQFDGCLTKKPIILKSESKSSLNCKNIWKRFEIQNRCLLQKIPRSA